MAEVLPNLRQVAEIKGGIMRQEDINDLLRHRQQKSISDKATAAMKKAVAWLEDDRADDEYITEEWYWEMKRLLMDYE